MGVLDGAGDIVANRVGATVVDGTDDIVGIPV